MVSEEKTHLTEPESSKGQKIVPYGTVRTRIGKHETLTWNHAAGCQNKINFTLSYTYGPNWTVQLNDTKFTDTLRKMGN